MFNQSEGFSGQESFLFRFGKGQINNMIESHYVTNVQSVLSSSSEVTSSSFSSPSVADSGGVSSSSSSELISSSESEASL